MDKKPFSLLYFPFSMTVAPGDKIPLIADLQLSGSDC